MTDRTVTDRIPDLFLITGGGTGAKVAEALTHLCAAGLGPERLHVLFIDSDTTNGNLTRARRTVEAYSAMQRWPWSVQARVGYKGLGRFKKAESEWLSLFSTEVRAYEITEQVRTVMQGGIESVVGKNSKMHQVLDLLYDPGEQAAKCDDGFRARPNLGCLLMTDHLREMLPKHADGFLQAIKNAAVQDGVVPIVMAASVFGGTGASLLPIIRGSFERVLKSARYEVNADALARLRWGSIKMLPHYQPERRAESVDPGRYLLDTSSALQYYGTVYETMPGVGHYHAMYFIGSDDPSRNQVKTRLGASDQANPGFFEEVIAALAVLDHARHASSNQLEPMRVYAASALQWGTLPFPNNDALKLSLAYLLHLAAFYLRRGGESGRDQQALGLARFIALVDEANLTKYPWYSELLDTWAQQHPAYRASEGPRRVDVLKSTTSMGPQSFEAVRQDAGAYFGRLLLWAERALRPKALPLFDYRATHYAGLHATMSDIKTREIDVHDTEAEVPFERDNALVRLLRAATSALIHHHKQNTRGKSLNDPVKLFDESQIRLNTSYQQTKDTLRDLSLGSIIDEYTSTAMASSEVA